MKRIFTGRMFIIPNDFSRVVIEMEEDYSRLANKAKQLEAEAAKAENEEEAAKLRLQAIEMRKLALWQAEQCDRMTAKIKKFFGEFDKNDAMVEIRVSSDEETNWADGEWPGIECPDGDESSEAEIRKKYFEDRFPKYIPASKLEGVKEGDTIEFTLTDNSDRVIKLTAKQIGSKYGYKPYTKNEWTFEEAFRDRMEILEAYERGETLILAPLGIPYKKEN